MNTKLMTVDKKNIIETPHLAISADFSICNQQFSAVIVKNGGVITLGAKWIKTGSLNITDIINYFLKHYPGLEVPEFLNFDFPLKNILINFMPGQNKLVMEFEFDNDLKLVLKTFEESGSRVYLVELVINKLFDFSSIPVIGGLLKKGDGLNLKSVGARKKDKGFFSAGISFSLILGGKEFVFDYEYETNDFINMSDDHIKWININKSIKILTIHKIGFSFEAGKIAFYIDASFSLAVFTLTFYELFISNCFPPLKFEPKFGLSGLMVSFKKPPLQISGGLYKAQKEVLYNGKIQVQFQKFSLMALGSYGEFDNGEKNLFLYLILNAPIGGPPAFFITGLAAGFGINRKFIEPELKKVREFPLVKAAFKDSDSKLNDKSQPQDALNVLSKHIVPSAGDYFGTIGVSFKSFNLLNSFLLLTLAINTNFKIILLGLSEASIPPNLKPSDNPIAFAQLALRAVYDNEQKTLQIEATLTDESYLFTKKCKLTGGFAFYVWGQGEHKGDFVVTLGGMWFPNYNRPNHYPLVDKLGINWQITSQLALKGSAYFAITPSCLMAGGSLNITYNAGKLKAWLTAKIDMLIKWKPFFYEAYIKVSIGASYKLLFITATLEARADLHIWGPNFSGKMHIKWFIISFTISFGSNAAKPGFLDWDEFNDSFIPKELPSQVGLRYNYSNDPKAKTLSSIRVTKGIVDEIELNGLKLLLVNPYELELETRSEIPITVARFNGLTVYKYNGELGIVPMGVKNLSNTHKVNIKYTDEGTNITKECTDYIVTEVLENLNSALWSTNDPGLNSGVLKDLLTGLNIKAIEPIITGDRLPKDEGRYEIEILERHEKINKKFDWSKEAISDNLYSKCNTYDEIKKTIMVREEIRKKMISELQELFYIDTIVSIGNIKNNPEGFFINMPKTCEIGTNFNENK